MASHALIADIGGTHARFAVVDVDGSIIHPHVLRGRDYATLWDAYVAYREKLPSNIMFDKAALAVAGPITGDQVTITNRRWSFSKTELKQALGVSRLEIMNDFKALALSLPHLAKTDKISLFTPEDMIEVPRAPLVVIGPGTGLGVATLIPVGSNEWMPLPGEGGHVMLPAANATEATIIAALEKKFDYVSAERVLSGQGLLNLYSVLAEQQNSSLLYDTPEKLADGHQKGDPIAKETLLQFCAFLGNVAGDAALTSGSLGGIYLAGGILPMIKDILLESEFVSRVQKRVVVESYMMHIPLWLIVTALPAFIGLRFFLNESKE